MEEDDVEILEAVLTEGIDALEQVVPGLNKLRAHPEDLEPLDILFRSFHSIKGNTMMVGLTQPSQFAHSVEDSIDKVCQSGGALSEEQISLLEEATDLLIAVLNAGGRSAAHAPDMEAVIVRLAPAFGIDAHKRTKDAIIEHQDEVDLQVAAASALEEKTQNARRDQERAKNKDKDKDKDEEEQVRVGANQLLGLESLAGDLFHLAERLGREVQLSDTTHANGELTELAHTLEDTTGQLYERLLDMQRVAPTNLARSLARIVRETCRKQGKKINFEVIGADVRIDRRAVSLVRDGLVHMVRNAVDHGVEAPEVRRDAGKDETANVRLEISDQEDSVAFRLRDDGKGIDIERVRKKAVSLGLLGRDDADAMPTEEVIEFIYHPGFSTAAEVSELSGRGVGMNVVAEDVRGAGGTIRVQTELGKGTRFELTVPKANSPVVDGLVVRACGNAYLVRLKSVGMFTDWSDVRRVNTRAAHPMVVCEMGTLPLLALPGADRDSANTSVALVLVDSNNHQVVVPVDTVLGRHRVLTASIDGGDALLGRELEAFVLGRDTIGYVLDVDDLLSTSAHARQHAA